VNLSACTVKYDETPSSDATLNPATLFPLVTSSTYWAFSVVTEPETAALVSDNVLTEAARDELLIVILEDTLVILAARDEDSVPVVLSISLIDDANEELLSVILVTSSLILVAAELLLVVIVSDNETMEDFSDADAA
jgi:hypothetical protein